MNQIFVVDFRERTRVSKCLLEILCFKSKWFKGKHLENNMAEVDLVADAFKMMYALVCIKKG